MSSLTPSTATPAREATLSPLWVNLVSLPLGLALLALCLSAYVLLWGLPPLLAALGAVKPTALAVLAGGILLHEALHALGWRWFAGLPWSAIRLGFAWRSLMPYAHAKAPVRAGAYRWAGVLPGLVTGLLPALLGLATGRAGWLMWGAVFLVAALGDGLILWVLRGVPADALVVDHPSKPGCLVYAEADGRPVPGAPG
jgi:hypothetical protein